VEHIKTVAMTLFWIGLGIAFFPALNVLCSFGRPFIPNSIQEFFLKPTFLDDEEEIDEED
jgi:hypothetical protein